MENTSKQPYDNILLVFFQIFWFHAFCILQKKLWNNGNTSLPHSEAANLQRYKTLIRLNAAFVWAHWHSTAKLMHFSAEVPQWPSKKSLFYWEHRGQRQMGAGLFKDMTEWGREREREAWGYQQRCHLNNFVISHSERRRQRTETWLSRQRPIWKIKFCFAEEFICNRVTGAFIRIQAATDSDAASLGERKINSPKICYQSSKPDRQNKMYAPVRVWETISSDEEKNPYFLLTDELALKRWGTALALYPMKLLPPVVVPCKW